MNASIDLRTYPLDDDNWERAVKLVPVDLESTARSERALQRRRQVRSANALLRMVLAYALCDWSLRLVGIWASVIGLAELSDVAVLHRLRKCRAWLGKIAFAWLLGRRKGLAQREVRV